MDWCFVVIGVKFFSGRLFVRDYLIWVIVFSLVCKLYNYIFFYSWFEVGWKMCLMLYCVIVIVFGYLVIYNRK